MAALRPQFGPREAKAQELKTRFNWLRGFTDEELRKISMCALEEGDRQANEEYFDLSRPELGPLRGRSGATVPEGSCYVAKSQVDESVWRKLVDNFPR